MLALLVAAAACTAVVEPIAGTGDPGGAPGTPGAPGGPGDDAEVPPGEGPEAPGDPSVPVDPGTDPVDPGAPGDPQEPVAPPCSYPAETALEGTGSVMPKLVWSDARAGDGSAVLLDLEEVHCSGEYNAIVFVLVAEWCPNCPSALTGIAQENGAIEAAGGLVVVVDLQRNDYSLPSNANAHSYISGYIGGAPVLRVGDGGSDRPGTINEASLWSAVPGGFVVRTSDMQVVANQEDSPWVLDWAGIVAEQGPPSGGGGGGGGGGGAGACTEEAHEPNDAWAQAPAIAPGTFAGGVCDSGSDYFKVNVAGDWRLELDFVHAQGDIDVYVCDDDGQPLQAGGALVGAESGDDDESFEWHGPATVRVYGWQGATNSYTLTLAGLGGL